MRGKMNNPIKQNPRQHSSSVIWAGTIAAVILIAFVYVYHFEPLSGRISPYWNEKLYDVLILIPAVAAALFGTLLTRQFTSDEPPHRIWLVFTIGWWWWVAGELSGFVYDEIYPVEYPEITFIDLCWLMGYFFFGLALYYQFRLIYCAQKKRRSMPYLVLIGIGLAVTFGLTKLATTAGLGEGISWLALYIAVLYPVCDLTEGVAAVWLSFLFGRGIWGRPWWGLIAFAIADGINIFFWIGGGDQMSDRAYYILDTFSNTVYVMGYCLVAIAFLANYNLIRYGPGERKTRPTGGTPQAGQN
jgi:hypothetical protein